jgi:hypothetical protein
MKMTYSLMLFLGLARWCTASKQITVDVERIQTKSAKSPFEKFGLNKSSEVYELPDSIKLMNSTIPVDLITRGGLAYSGPVFLGQT